MSQEIQTERQVKIEQEYAEKINDLDYCFCVISAIKSAYGYFERFKFNAETSRYESDSITKIELERKTKHVQRLLDYPNKYPKCTREPEFVPDDYKEKYNVWKQNKPFILSTLKELDTYYCHTIYVKVDDGVDYLYLDDVTENEFKSICNSLIWFKEKFFPEYGKVVTLFNKG